MKTFIALFALFLSLSLTAQTNTATWYRNDTSGSGIQSYQHNIASGAYSISIGNYTEASGYASTAMGYDTTASGDHSTAMGRFTTASGDDSTAMGHETSASGYGSFAAGVSNVASGSWGSTALGSSSVASGLASVAIGDQVDATGNHSTAMGFFTTASGHSSTALGYGSTASGKYGATALGSHTIASGHTSTAIGNYTTAEDIYSFVIGVHNNTDETPNPESFSYQNTAFVIGNGGHDSEGNYVGTSDTFSNAFEVLFDGTTNVAGSVTATAFIGDGSQLTNLPTVNYSDITNVPMSFNENGTGVQSPNNTASGQDSFTVGYATTASGQSSTAMGMNTRASGHTSTAMGDSTTASGSSSTAMGFQTEASGDYSTAMGYKTTASGQYATAIGSSGDGQGSAQMVASGYSSVALGGGTKATNNFAIAMGSGSEASGVGSTAMGTSTKATSWQSTAMGWFSKANGEISTAMGYETEADGFNTTAIGSLNTVDENSDPDNWSYSNRAFVIGNGGWDSNGNFTGLRSDALTVLFDGTTTIAGDLSINSDARLKANIISLGSTLAKLLQIDGKSYTMKKDESKKQKIGLLAQDIEKVFPELVSESNGIKSVNYQGLVPVLINALKEQDAMMKKQESKYLEQEKRLERLERLVAAMD